MSITRNAISRPRQRVLTTGALLSLLVAMFAASPIGTLADPGRSRPCKISPLIIAHQDEKADSATLPVERRTARLRLLGLESSEADAEFCALYVANKLTDKEIAELAAINVRVNSDDWVPALPGRHAHGFYSATVPYAALPAIRRHSRIVYAESLESVSRPLNAGARYMINAEDVLTGNGIVARDGTGINIAIADTGIDLTHTDFPTPAETYDMTTGTSTANWNTNVVNTVMDHGTHVTGSALGRGTLSPNNFRRGSAPAASLYFYKIGDNTTASATDADMIEAINRALAVGCHIFSMSYGGISPFMDGSGPVCQAIDNASAAGMVCVIAAGNDGDTNRHHSISVPPATTSGTFGFTVSNVGFGTAYSGPEDLRVLWRDNNALDNNLALSCTNLGGSESLTAPWSSSSTRGTEARQYLLTVNLAPGASKTYNLRLQNTAASGTTPLVHTWRAGGRGTFVTPDVASTINHPGLADTAISIGAWVQDNQWRDWQNNLWQFPTWSINTLAPFSSHGPRIDGARKPSVTAPGAVTASCRDSGTFSGYPQNLYIVDNDNFNDGLGPANYYIHWGTSMATPMAAGAIALLLEAGQGMTPAQVLATLEATASNAGSPDDTIGAGLIDIKAAIQTIDCNDNGVYDPIDVATQDCNSNGVPDDCDVTNAALAYTLAAYYPGSGQGISGTPVAADIDGDGDDDLVNGSTAFGNPINILWNNGNGTFTQIHQFIDGNFYSIGSVVAADFDMDADVDLVVVQGGNPPYLRVLLNDGSGNFSLGAILNATFNTGPAIFTADVNLDTIPDVVFLHSWFGVHRLGVILNNGNATFADPVIHSLSQAAGALRFADLDNDADPDALMTMGTNLAAAFNDGAGNFTSPVSYAIGTGFNYDVGDLNGDGSIDVAVRAIYYSSPPYGSSSLEIFLNDGSGTLTHDSSQNGMSLDGAAMVVADANGDLIPDVIVASSSPAIAPLINDGSATFILTTPTLETFGQLYSVAVLLDNDLDDNGTTDFVALQSGYPNRSIVWGVHTPPASTDCNANGAPDDCDIAIGAALDCQSDGIPDDCQLVENDCNANGVPDDCDITMGGSFDFNGNAVPDECESAICTSCPGDIDGDNEVDAGDLQGFTSCVLGGSALATGCACAALDAGLTLDAVDVALLADKLVTDDDPSCP